MQDNKEIHSLTGLRFFAAFCVFLFHIHIRWPLTTNSLWGNIFSQGAVGMSLFFMLSGFLLAYRYIDGKSSLYEYFINRFARIYPIYVAAAIFTLPWIGVKFVDNSLSANLEAIAKTILLVFTNIFLIQAWFPPLYTYWNDSGSWSISVEVFCYILLPFVLPYLAKSSIKQLYVIAAVCWFCATLPGVFVSIFDSQLNIVFYSMPIFRLPEFLIGVCIYLAMRSGLRYSGGISYQIIIIGIFFLYLGLIGSKMHLYIGHNWIVIPTIAFTIFSVANGKGAFASFLSNKIFTWLGKISYCIYSFQALLTLTLIQYHSKIVQTVPLLSDNKLLAISALIILLIISTLGYYLIEEPSRKLIRQYRKNKTIPA